MARGVNKCILVGNLGHAPEIRHTAGGSAVANFTMATSRSWTDKSTGERQEETTWHRIVLFGALAEIAEKYLHKGAQAYIEGRLQTRKWVDRDGADRYTTEIVGDQLLLLGGKGESADAGDAKAYAKASGASGRKAPAQQALPEQDFDDDIPF